MNIYSNNELSLKAKGIYFLIEYLNNNNLNVNRMILKSMTNTGEKSIETGIKELKSKGFLTIEKINVNGKFIYKYKLNK